MAKNPPDIVGDVRDVGPIPASRRSPGGGHGDPLQYSRLENPMDRGAWRATVHKVAQSQIWLKRFGTHSACEILKPGTLRRSAVGQREGCRSQWPRARPSAVWEAWT